MKLRPYPEYRDSGVPWLGQVSAHWEVRRARNAVDMKVSNVDKHTKEGELPVRLCNYVDVYKNDRITERVSFMRATATEDPNFRDLGYVPDQGITLTIPAILAARQIFTMVPLGLKKPILTRLLNTPEPTPALPASILSTVQSRLFADRDSCPDILK